MPMVHVSEPRPHVRLITLDDPETMNSMSFDLVTDLYEAIAQVGADNDCAVAVLTGAGRGFCSGLNLEAVGLPPGAEGLTLGRLAIRSMEVMSDLVPAMRRMPQPIIAAVNGAAFGGGMCLSMGADIRVAAESAVFNATGINNGLAGVELGLSYLLPRYVGAARAQDIILTGRRVDAAEALRIGLVAECVPDDVLMERALDKATQIAELSTFGVAMTKKVLWDALECGSLESAIDLENRNQLLVRMLTQNLDEAIRARRENRKPVFRD